LGFLGEWRKQFFPTYHHGPHGKLFLNKIFQRVAYENIKFKDGIDMEVYEYLDFVNYDWHVPCDPQYSKNSPKGLLKNLLVETSDILPKRASVRNSDMILVSTVGLCRASTVVPLNEEVMAVEGE
jgi:hypothetical protein